MADKEGFFVGDFGGTLQLLVGTVAEGGPDLTGSNITVFAEFQKPTRLFDEARLEDGGSFINETVALTDEVLRDIDLLPDISIVVDDAFYFISLATRFASIDLDIGQAGIGNWALAWEYTNDGQSWSALPNLVDGTNDFKNFGPNRVSWTFPSDWAKVLIDGVYGYAVRARVTTGDASPSAQPQGNSARMGLVEISGTVTDASNGEISITIPQGLFDEPGRYRVQSKVVDGSDSLHRGRVIELDVKEQFAH